MIFLALVAAVAGLFLLAKSADTFVGGAARLASALNIPPVVIGAVVVGFGTSAPEMVVSGIASGQGKLDIAAGNIIGSNVANLTLVLGVASLLCTMHVDSKVLKREAPLAFAATVLFAILIQDGLERWEGVVLLVGLFAALAVIVFGGKGGDDELAAEVEEFLESDEELSTGREALRTLLGLVGVVAGAQLTVYGASTIAEEVGLGEGFVGLTLVAIGTSLPELVTAIAAARKDEHELIIGNLLGSNLFNSLAVGGIAGIVGPGELVEDKLAGIAVVSMLVVSFGAWLFMRTGRRIASWEAITLLAVYVITVPLLA